MASHILHQHSDGSKPSGIQIETARVATGNILAGLIGNITITWGTAFPDVNYTIAPTIESGLAATLQVDSLVSKTAGGCVIAIKNISISTNGGTVHVIAIGD